MGEVRQGSGPGERSAPGKQSSAIVAVGAPIDPATFPAVIAGSAASQARLVERTLLIGGAPVERSALSDAAIDDESGSRRRSTARPVAFRRMPSPRAEASQTLRARRRSSSQPPVCHHRSVHGPARAQRAIRSCEFTPLQRPRTPSTGAQTAAAWNVHRPPRSLSQEMKSPRRRSWKPRPPSARLDELTRYFPLRLSCCFAEVCTAPGTSLLFEIVFRSLSRRWRMNFDECPNGVRGFATRFIFTW